MRTKKRKRVKRLRLERLREKILAQENDTQDINCAESGKDSEKDKRTPPRQIKRVSREEMKHMRSPGKASDHIHHITDLISQSDTLRVVIYCRVSTPNQRNQLEEMEHNIREALTDIPVKIIKCYREVGSAKYVNSPTLIAAIKHAKTENAIVLAESTDRFVRNEAYTPSTNFDCQPTNAQYAKLEAIADGVRLATLQAPDASDSEQRSIHTSRGMKPQNKRGGRPRKITPGDKKRRRTRLYPVACKMRQAGNSLREIAKEIGISHSTIQSWFITYGVRNFRRQHNNN